MAAIKQAGEEKTHKYTQETRQMAAINRLSHFKCRPAVIVIEKAASIYLSTSILFHPKKNQEQVKRQSNKSKMIWILSFVIDEREGK